jgi:hypothetical protein
MRDGKKDDHDTFNVIIQNFMIIIFDKLVKRLSTRHCEERSDVAISL